MTDTPTPAPFDDLLPLAQDLIRCRSITPADDGAIDRLIDALTPLGFACTSQWIGGGPDDPAPVRNLWARLGTGGRNFCFAGHTDVVPPGAPESWSVDPFDGTVAGGKLFGRGAADMKGAIAAFITATRLFLADHPEFDESISLLITGDEEGEAVNGTRPMLGLIYDTWGQRIDQCLVGEPTNPRYLGEMAKIGRRGSLNGRLRVQGVQGHVAYPHLADNPVPKLLRLLTVLDSLHLDDGNAHFPPSNLEIVTVDVGNAATNVIPASASAGFNIRFNDQWTGAGLEALLLDRLAATGIAFDLRVTVSGESFLCPPGPVSAILDAAVRAVTGHSPELSTSGGTSDARFISRYCPVIEFGLIGASMHKFDEHAALADLDALARIYRRVLEGYFAHPLTAEPRA